MPSLRRGAKSKIARRRRTQAPTLRPNEKPTPGKAYLEWLDRTWPGDTRELREGRYLHQQGNLRIAFERSKFWLDVRRELSDWAHAYEKHTGGYALFPGAPAMPALANKPWRSFLSRTWRENVHNNGRWPEPPEGGWWLPDNWFERAWDIVRTRFVVRYLDGVEELSERLVDAARARKLEASYDKQAKGGFFAFQVGVRQPFSIDTLDYQGTLERSSVVELQVMTDLADVISDLTHPHYEERRESDPGEAWGWDYRSPAAETNVLGTLLHDLESRVMKCRDGVEPAGNGPKRHRRPRRRRGERA